MHSIERKDSMDIKRITSCVGALVLSAGLVVAPQVLDTSNTLVISAEDEEYTYSGTCGENATFEFDESTGTLTISGTGDMEDYYTITIPWNTYRKSIKTIVIQNGVTNIGAWAFWGSQLLKNVTVSDSVTYIGDNAFNSSTLLEDIVLPNSITSIGEGAFYNCTSLKNVTIPDSVTSIGYGAFEGCSALTDVYFQGTEEEWNSIEIGDYNGCLTNATIHYNSTGSEDTPTTSTTVTGDLDGDGEVTALDLVALKQGLLGIDETSTASDLNGDGEVNVLDLLLLKRYLLGIITTLG
jgi:hypothetical protein